MILHGLDVTNLNLWGTAYIPHVLYVYCEVVCFICDIILINRTQERYISHYQQERNTGVYVTRTRMDVTLQCRRTTPFLSNLV